MKKYRNFLFFSFIISTIIFISCGGKNHIKLPEGIVVPDTMASVLADVHLLQASAQLGYTQNPDDSTVPLSYASLWKKHGLTQESYDKNLKFYCDHPSLLDSVYEKVIGKLNQEKAELMGPQAKPAK